jgi:predicted transcriptional regulator
MKFRDFLNEELSNDEFRKEYDALAPKYAIIEQIIKERSLQSITQKELAKRTGIRQSNISRLENGNYNPSIEFLQKVAAGLGKKIYIELR